MKVQHTQQTDNVFSFGAAEWNHFYQEDSTTEVYLHGLRHSNYQNSSTTETGRTSSSLCIWSHPCERSHTGTPTSRRTSIIIAIYAIVDPLYELPEAE